MSDDKKIAIADGIETIGDRQYMRDAKGRIIPVDQVRGSDQMEDQLVRHIMAYALDLSAQIARFKAHCFDDVGAHIDLLGEKYGVSRKTPKGNMTFSSYDGTIKVQIAVADTLFFGPELQIAQGLVDECISEWVEGSRDEIRRLVQDAFAPDKQGQVSREKIFALRRIKIDDDRWVAAVEAINDSIRVQGSTTYLRFYRRATPTDPWRTVTIDLASAEAPVTASAAE